MSFKPPRKNDRTHSLAISFRPKGGLTMRHEQLMTKWLYKYCDQWKGYVETVNDDPSSRHLHLRVLLKEERRMDKVKVLLINGLECVLAEKKALLGGIKWLYDDWDDYISKDGQLWDINITDEDAWIYADPAEKYVKVKNAWPMHCLGLISSELGEVTTAARVEQLMWRYWAFGLEEAPKTENSRKELCKLVATIHNYRMANPDQTPDSDL